MAQHPSRTFWSFDRTRQATATVSEPDALDALSALPAGTLIARGAGYSFADAGVVHGGHVVDMRRMNRVLAFDAEGGRITVEPGLSVGALQTIVAAKGWVYPVVPGYPTITVGGSIAWNVHGKGQARDGTFGDWVESLRLWHPAHGVVSCSRAERPELFALTIGGFGMTGIIIDAELRLRRIKGHRVTMQRIDVRDMLEAATIIRDAERDADYAYSWHDLNHRGARFGRGVVFVESVEPVFDGGVPRGYGDGLAGITLRTPWSTPDWVVRFECFGFRWVNLRSSAPKSLSLHDAMFPIVGKEVYHRQWGTSGFREYQLLVSWEQWPSFTASVQEAMARTGIVATLGSLKVFKGTGHHLSLAGDGVCFSVDVPNNRRSVPFFELLDEALLRHGAIPNLSKDSRIGADVVRASFPCYDAFKQALTLHDPARRFQSDLSRRIGL